MRSWRDTCSEALHAFTQADALRLWRLSSPTDQALRPPFDYRYEHTLAVVKLARWLSPLVGADGEVVECAAWLHDCRKRLKDAGGKDHHAQEASAEVASVLAGTDFPEAKIPAVRHAIEHHVGLTLTHRLEPLETACLWDCDKLSKIGAASLIHFVSISGAFQPTTTAQVLQRGEQWLELAHAIAASMNTKPARLEAQGRLTFLERFYAQLGQEWREPVPGAVP